MRGRSTFLYSLPAALMDFGVRTSVLAGHDEYSVSHHMPSGNEVPWFPACDASEVLRVEWDALVMMRGLRDGWPEIMAKKRIFCPRDLPHAGLVPHPDVIKCLSMVVYLSNYAKSVWECYYPSLKEVDYEIIPNGVDRDLFFDKPTNGLALSKLSLLFCSNPNRGIWRLPIIKEGISKKLGREVDIICLSDHFVLHPEETPIRGLDEAMSFCREGGISLSNPVSQAELSEIMSMCSLMLLPSDYPEICSNAVLQSLSCGLPVITSQSLGSADEFIPSGCLVRWLPHDGEVYLREFVLRCLELITDQEYYDAISSQCSSMPLEWKEIAGEWTEVL